MAIRVGRGVRSSIREDPGGIGLQVQGAGDAQAAHAALEAARRDIARLDGGWQSAPGLSPGHRNGPKWLSAVIGTPSGPALFIDGGYTPTDLLLTVPELIARQLEVAGVNDAVIAVPRDDHDVEVRHLPRAVVLHLYPPLRPRPNGGIRRGKIPASWLETAEGWLNWQGELWVDALVRVRAPMGALPEMMGVLRQAGRGTILAGDVTGQIRSVLFARWAQVLSLAFGGPAATDDDLHGFDELRAIAERHGHEAAYAFVSIEPSFGLFSNVPAETELAFTGGARGDIFKRLADHLVPDAFPYQVLGPGHLMRLEAEGLWPPDPPGCRFHRLGPNVGLSIGEPESWLFAAPVPVGERSRYWFGLGSHRRDPRLQDDARSRLAPCLLGEAEARELLGQIHRQEQGKST